MWNTNGAKSDCGKKREIEREREGDRERERISLFFLVVSLDVLWVKMFGMYNGSDEYRLVCLMMRQQVYIAKVCTCIKIERWLVWGTVLK